MQRRQFLKALGAIGSIGLSVQPARGHDAYGPVTPSIPAPALRLRMSDGRVTTLLEVLSGKTTALNLMFTGCSASCPIQGFLFSQVLEQISARELPTLQLLSLSISPATDNPPALRKWLESHSGRAPWHAASPLMTDIEEMPSLFRTLGRSDDPHTGSVYIFDDQARLVWRTLDLPPATEITRSLLHASGAVTQ